MRYIIFGSGKVGSRLAMDLDSEGHDVTLVANSAESLRRLSRTTGVKALIHEGVDVEYLTSIGAVGADALIAVTDDDDLNVMAARVAQEFLGIQHVVARIYDPELAAFYSFRGLRVICPTTTVVGLTRAAME